MNMLAAIVCTLVAMSFLSVVKSDYQIRSTIHTSYCLTANNDDCPSSLRLSHCNFDSPQQRFKIEANPTSVSVSQYYVVQGMCISNYRDVFANNGQIILWGCVGQPNQRFRAIQSNLGGYMIQFEQRDMCLYTTGAHNDRIVQNACDSNNAGAAWMFTAV